jgi:hypothetical protein
VLAHKLRRAAGRPVITYRTYVEDTANLTTYSFAGIDVGTAPCLVLVAFHMGGATSRTLSSGTIDGSAATVHGSGSGDFSGVAFMSRSFTPGAAVTIAGTWSGACSRSAIGVWTITNLASATPSDSDFSAGGAAASRTRTVDVPAGGIAIFAGTRETASAITTSVGTGSISERYDAASETQNQFAGGDSSDNGGASPVCTMNAVSAMCGIAFR